MTFVCATSHTHSSFFSARICRMKDPHRQKPPCAMAAAIFNPICLLIDSNDISWLEGIHSECFVSSLTYHGVLPPVKCLNIFLDLLCHLWVLTFDILFYCFFFFFLRVFVWKRLHNILQLMFIKRQTIISFGLITQ